MTLVVDASIVVPAALGGRLPVELTREELIAPALMWSESASAIHELAFRGEVDPETASSAIRRLRELDIACRDHPDLHLEASRVARGLGWAKTYDAEYVTLAQVTGSRLLTRDARLQRGAGRVVSIIGPEALVSPASP